MFLLLFLLLLSCGIKGSPKPPPEPVYQVKRIGDKVCVIGKDIVVEGFKKVNGYYLKKEDSEFCFKVKRIKGREKTSCVKKALKFKPSIEIIEKEDYILLKGNENEIYRVYRISKGIITFPHIKEFKGKGKIERKYEPYKIAITQVFSENYESEPLIIEVKPKPKPVPKPPEVSYLIYENKVYIFIFHENYEKILGFYIYKNGKRIFEKPIKRNYFVDELPKKKTIYEISAVNNFGIESKKVKIIVPQKIPKF